MTLLKKAIFSIDDEPLDAEAEVAEAGALAGGQDPFDVAPIAVLGPRPLEFFTGVIFSISRNIVAMVGFSNPSITGDKCSDINRAISKVL